MKIKNGMKRITLMSIAALLFGTINAQEINFKDLSTTTERGEFTSYIGSDGGVYRVGDRIKIGVPSSNKTFAFIWMGDGILTVVAVSAPPMARPNGR